MAKLRVTHYPEKVLAVRTAPVSSVGPGERRLIQDMIDTMRAEGGVGLAANQIGVPKRIFVISQSGKPGDERVFVNPVIRRKSGTQIGGEGCLSVPDVALKVRRARHVEYEALNQKGELVRGKADDFLARIIQHEMDHLDGKLIIDRVDFDARQKALSQYESL